MLCLACPALLLHCCRLLFISTELSTARSLAVLILWKGQSPLMNAVLSGNTGAVKILLAAGADTSIAEQDGYTPMHGAGFQGRAEIAKLLIEHGLNPSDRHKDGYTPLHRACWGGEPRHTETVRVLLEAGVSPQEKASNGGMPVQMAQNNPATRKLLHTHMHKDTPIPGASGKAEL